MSHLDFSSDSLDRIRHQGKATYNADDNRVSTISNTGDSSGVELTTTQSMVLTDSRSKTDQNGKLATVGAHGQPPSLGSSAASGQMMKDETQRIGGAQMELPSSGVNSGEVHENGSGSTYTGKPVASFRRQRASRACELTMKQIPAPKRKKNQKKDPNSPPSNESNQMSPPMPMKRTSIRPDLDNIRQMEEQQERERQRQRQASLVVPEPPLVATGPPQSAPPTTTTNQENLASQYPSFMKPKFARAPIREAGRVAYLGESSNLSLLVHDKHGSADVVHYPLPDDIRGPRARLCDLDNLEIDILHQRGAFLLPPRILCDELVDAYFTWVAPVVPIINRSRFMRRYQDPKNPPSLLLLQAMLLAGCRVCTNTQLMDASGSTTPAAMTFYKRAKALIDANYEDDRVTIVQALVLMDVTKNVFYWTRVATAVAQGSGMHRSVESSQLSRTDKRLWKRIWWTLYTRDRSVAVALGRPISVNTCDSDVEMITEDDFIEDETDTPNGIPVQADYPPDRIHVQFFLQYVKLCEIMGLVLSQQYSVASKAKRGTAIDLTHSDIALADWLQNCPREMCWQKERHHFWSALLHSNYYTTLCLLHRAHMPPATMAYAQDEGRRPSTQAGFVGPGGTRVYPSKTIAFQAAAMVTSIINQLQIHDQLRFTPAFIVYSLFSALIMHVYQMRSSDPQTVSACHEKISICMRALRDVSHAWLVAKMVHTLFESILGNKAMEEKMQRAAGKRHHHFRQMQKQGHGYHQQRPQFPQRRPHTGSGMSHVSPATLQKSGPAGGGPDTVNPAATNTASATAGVPGSPAMEEPAPAANVTSTPINGSAAAHETTAASIGPPDITHGQGQHEPFSRKRKFSDLEQVALPGSRTPMPHMSYERSRPQTPVSGAVGVNGDGGQSNSQHTGSNSERTRKNTQHHNNQTRHDAFLGAPEPGEHGATRPTSPFYPAYSPNLSQTMWENFQPDQLFPDGAMRGLGLEEFGFDPANPAPASVHPAGVDSDLSGRAGAIQNATVDPGLQTSAAPQALGTVSDIHGQLQQQQPPTSLMSHQTLPATDTNIDAQINPLYSAHVDQDKGFQQAQQHLQQALLDGPGGLQEPPGLRDGPLSDDDWSNSSTGASGGPQVPLTLNVEDWFQFFGLQGCFDAA
ncbi:Transcriptional activator of fatty acid utilization [Ascosphaera pollenicola]|nr:Transcriptional activator of fatty acid utilization [Ascosphaera pollenicola]